MLPAFISEFSVSTNRAISGQAKVNAISIKTPLKDLSRRFFVMVCKDGKL